jgi:hypothetical protein
MTETEQEQLQSQLDGSRKAYQPSELPAHIWEMIKDARMGSGHSHLDKLLED